MTDEITVRFQQYCSQMWWLVLLRGIAVIVLGGMLVSRPGLTAVVLVQFLGAYFLVDGVITIINSIMARKHMQGWIGGLVVGLLECLTGIAIFAHPLASTIFTASVLLYFVAIMAILFGVLGVVLGIQVLRDRNDGASFGGGGVALIAGGVLAIGFGVILIMNPEASAKAYLIAMGVMAIFGGLFQVFASFQIRKIGKMPIEPAAS